MDAGLPHPLGNIRVLCRLKPLTEDEQQGDPGGARVEASPTQDGCVTACYKGKEHSFRLDKVFLPGASQEEVGMSCRLPFTPSSRASAQSVPPPIAR